MKHIQKIIAFVLCLIMALALIPTAFAEDTVLPEEPEQPEVRTGMIGDGVTWTLSDSGTMTFSGTGSTWSCLFSSPEFWDYRSDVKKLIVESGVTGIGDAVFYGLNNLTEISLSDTVMGFGVRNGLGLINLETITVDPENPNLKTVDGVLFSADMRVLLMYPAKKTVAEYRVPDGVVSIPECTIFCTALETVILPDTLQRVGEATIYGCDHLCSVYFEGMPPEPLDLGCEPYGDPRKVTVYYPASLAAYWAPDGETTLPDGYALVPYDLPEQPDLSGQCGDDLYWSFNVESGTLTITGTGALWDCEQSKQPWSAYRSQVRSLSLPAGLTYIGDHAFEGLVNLPSVTIPEGVTMLGDYAFASCRKLKTVVIPDGCTWIGGYAFAYCDGLETVSVPDSLEVIQDMAFYMCVNLSAFRIPKNAQVHGGVFAGCYGLRPENFTIDPENECFFIEDGVLYERDPYEAESYCLVTYLCAKKDAEYTVHDDGVTEIFPYAFSYSFYLKSVTIPNVMYIDERAFEDCGVENVRILPGCREIGADAFSGCTNLKWIVLPGELRTVGGYFPDDDGSFRECDSLTDVYYIGTEAMKQERLADTLELRSNAPLKNAAWYYVDATYRVAFDSNGGSVVPAQTVSVMGFADKPADPVKNGSAFLGWECGGQPFDFSTRICGDITLTAKWNGAPEFDGTVEWNADDVKLNGKTPYVTYTGKAQTPRFTVKAADGAVIDPSHYTSEYRENVNAGTAYVIVSFLDTYSGTAQGWFKIYLVPTQKTTVENREDGIFLEWSAVDGAAGYVIYRRAWSSTTNGWTSFVRWNNTTELNWTDTKVYAGTRYQYGVKAYFAPRVDPVSGATIGGNVGDNYNLGQVGPLKTTVRITTRKLESVVSGSRRLTVKWSASKNFTGYEVQIATDAAFTKNVKTVQIANPKTSETTVKSLKAKTTYYVRVRSYHVFEGMTYYGGWSNVLTGKTK